MPVTVRKVSSGYDSYLLMSADEVPNPQRRQDQKVTAKKQSTVTTIGHDNPKTKQQQSSKTATTISHDQALMSLQQSNQIVKTMLDATFGCMTFLRLACISLFRYPLGT